MPHKDIEKRKEWRQSYTEKNREYIRERNRLYYIKNHDIIMEKRREKRDIINKKQQEKRRKNREYCQGRTFYIYFHYDTHNIVRYVGVGSDGYKGYGRSKSTHGRNTDWKDIFREHRPRVVIIRDNLTQREADELEIFYIKFFGRTDEDKNGLLVNKNSGGVGSRGKGMFTEQEIKDRVREQRRRSYQKTKDKTNEKRRLKRIKNKNSP